jgi:hypothetical protein
MENEKKNKTEEEDPVLIKKDTPVTIALLNKLLKQKMAAFDGGPSAIWERLDPRFKDNEEEEDAGKEKRNRRHNRKIRKNTFVKAVSILDKPGKTVEKMDFGLRGNPLLLMNVFKILGLTSINDLVKIDFAERGLNDVIFTIDTNVKLLKDQIVQLSDDFFTYAHKKTSKSALDTLIEFNHVTNRLQAIMSNGIDPAFANMSYLQARKAERDIYTIKNTPQGILNHLQKSSLNMDRALNISKNRIAVDSYLQNITMTMQNNDTKKTILMFNVLYDYSSYYIYDPLLRDFFQQFQLLNIINNSILNSDSNYIKSPLYIACFYINMARSFLKKVISKDTISTSDDERLKEKILNIFTEFERDTLVKSASLKDIVVRYLDARWKAVYEAIHHIIEIIYDKRPVLDYYKFSVYNNILFNVIMPFGIMLISRSPLFPINKNNESFQASGVSTLKQLYSFSHLNVTAEGNYNFTAYQFNFIEEIYTKAISLEQETRLDLL